MCQVSGWTQHRQVLFHIVNIYVVLDLHQLGTHVQVAVSVIEEVHLVECVGLWVQAVVNEPLQPEEGGGASGSGGQAVVNEPLQPEEGGGTRERWSGRGPGPCRPHRLQPHVFISTVL